MPVALSYPGVYIEEKSSGLHPIVGVSTSIAAFIGRADKGPIDRAVRILDRTAFARTYGEPIADSDLVYSVRQFFDNGGTDCYIVRVAHDAVAANLTLQTASGDDILVVEARDKGQAGNDLRLIVDYATPYPDDSFNLRVLEEHGESLTQLEEYLNLSMDPDSARFAPTFVTDSSSTITVTSAVGDLPGATPVGANRGYSQSRRPFAAAGIAAALNAILKPPGNPAPPPAVRFQISVDDGPWTAVSLAGPALAGAAAAVANTIQQRINDQIPATTPVTVTWEPVAGANRVVLQIASNSTNGASVRIQPSSVEDLAGPMMLGTSLGGVEVGRYKKWRPVPSATLFDAAPDVLAALAQSALTSLTVDAEPAIDLTSNGTPIVQTTAAGDLWYQAAAGSDPLTADSDGVREKLRILAAALNTSAPPATGVRTFRAEVWGYHLALIPVTGSASRQIAVTTSVPAPFDQSFRSGARRYALGHPGSPFTAQADPGTNGNGTPTITDFIGDPAKASGMHALDIVDLFNLMVLPSDTALGDAGIRQLAGPAAIYCSEHRAMLILDAPTTWTDPLTHRPTATSADVDGLRGLVTKKDVAVYYPRLKFSKGGRPGRIGPSGAVAGVMARTDVERGVWKAPAGVDANVRGILDLEATLSDREQGVLNKAGANVIRKFPAGIVVWGARTLAGTDDVPDEWKYVPIRRFALFLEETLFRATKWVVFEPNDEPLWANIRKNIRAFMLGLFRQGAFEGSTPDQAFYVKCDGETTTANDRNLGIVNIEVGFAPLKPAEFVVIQIQQIANDTQ